MSRRYYILLPGIRTDPKDWQNWAPRMATDIMVMTEAKADEFRYMAMAVTPKRRQRERAEYVQGLAIRCHAAGYEPVLVGHSNGCEIIRQALDGMPSIIHSAHLIAGATEADFEAGGWNRALREGIVGRIVCYVGKHDWVLRWVAAAGACLGYGRLGWLGPQRVATEVAHRVDVIERATDHTGWFDEPSYGATRAAVTVAERL